MLIVLAAIAALYFIWVVFILIVWFRIPLRENNPGMLECISVVIPVRNEESNIAALLTDLDNQDYPAKKITVYVMDDGSTDHTSEIVKELSGKVSYQLKYIDSANSRKELAEGKKKMIFEAIESTSDPIIIQTDGDCRVGSGWVAGMVAPFKNQRIRFTAGSVSYTDEKNFYARLLQAELSALQITSAAMIGTGLPVMCNGACIAYRRDAFLKSGGYTENINAVSGDDSFLMHSIHKNFPGSVRFIKDLNATVRTSIPGSLTEFYYQRIRWAGKWNLHQNLWTRFLAIFIFIANFNFILLSVYSTIYNHYELLLIIFVLKLAFEYLLIQSWSRFYRIGVNVFIFFLAGIIYPIYTFFFGIMANTSNFTWKGRNYSQPRNDRP